MSTANAEIPLEPFVPGGGEIGHGQVARHERAFEIEAHHDVEVVVHLVCLGPDEARMDPVDGGIESARIGNADIAEDRVHTVHEKAGEGFADRPSWFS